jgi:hypothetical protein
MEHNNQMHANSCERELSLKYAQSTEEAKRHLHVKQEYILTRPTKPESIHLILKFQGCNAERGSCKYRLSLTWPVFLSSLVT